MKKRVIAFASILLVAFALIIIFPQGRESLLQITRPRRAANSTPQVIEVKPGDNLQSVLNSAMPGDTIVLRAGASYVGNLTLPKKDGNEYITIRSSGAGELPENTRVSPKQAALLAKLLSAGKGQPVIKTALGAHHYKFVGIEISTVDASVLVYNMVELGSSNEDQNTLAKVAHHFMFDRCYVHGFPTQPVQRGMALNSAETSILNSWISDIHWDVDTQALCGWNGPGPFHIINNHLEAASENVMFGGALVRIPNLIPSDIEIRGNHFFKPLSWKLGDPAYVAPPWRSNAYSGYGVKNLFELKNAQRVTIDGNLFENCWGDAQVGYAIVLTSRGELGQNPWAGVMDVTFTNNIVRNAAGGVNLLGKDNYGASQQARNITIANNLFDGIGTEPLFQMNGINKLTIDHNTTIHKGNILTAYGEPTTDFTFTNNIVEQNQYGMFCEGAGPPSKCFPGGVLRKNVIVGGGGGYPDNFTVATLGDLKFADATRGDYGLSISSPFKRKATDNQDLGCDFALLRRALAASPN